MSHRKYPPKGKDLDYFQVDEVAENPDKLNYKEQPWSWVLSMVLIKLYCYRARQTALFSASISVRGADQIMSLTSALIQQQHQQKLIFNPSVRLPPFVIGVVDHVTPPPPLRVNPTPTLIHKNCTHQADRQPCHTPSYFKGYLLNVMKDCVCGGDRKL